MAIFFEGKRQEAVGKAKGNRQEAIGMHLGVSGFLVTF